MTQAINSRGDVSSSRLNDFTLVVGYNSIDGSSNTVDGAFPPKINEFQTFIVHNLALSTNEVKVSNALYTVRGKGGIASPGDDIVLLPGQTAIFKVTSATTLESL